MEDNKVAKKFISTIIGENVVELDLAAQEVQAKTERGLTVYHLDFVAKIAIDGGFKTVIIELQKAKLASDIMRFRRYVGQHYQDTNNLYRDNEGSLKARQIYCIFLLNHNIGYPNVPMIIVDPNVKDAATDKVLNSDQNEFIESLHHRSWIVQIPQLKAHRRNDIENLLSIFDQSHVVSSNKHMLDVKEEDFPEKYHDVVRRLLQAYATPEVCRTMEAEDDYLELLRDEERKAAAEAARADAAVAERDKAVAEMDEAVAEKDATAAERDEATAKADKATAALASKEREAAEAAAALATALAELEALKQQKSK
jgi:hypothetical protein